MTDTVVVTQDDIDVVVVADAAAATVVDVSSSVTPTINVSTGGPAGPGVAPGGTTGQILYKINNDDYVTAWEDFSFANIAPPGGLNGPDYVQFDIAAAAASGIGKVVWNDADGTLEFGLKGGNVTLQIGQETVAHARNMSGVTIPNGTAVYVTGASGNRITVNKALANADSTSATILGIATEQIGHDQTGFITTEGLVRDLDTSAFADGDVLYVSPTTAGAITNVKPVAPQHMVMIGFCVRSHATVGSIFVKVQNGYEVGELHDVHISGTPVDNSMLLYDALSAVWRNKTPSDARTALGIGTIATASPNATVRAVTGGEGSFEITGGATGGYQGYVVDGKTGFLLDATNKTVLYDVLNNRKFAQFDPAAGGTLYDSAGNAAALFNGAVSGNTVTGTTVVNGQTTVNAATFFNGNSTTTGNATVTSGDVIIGTTGRGIDFSARGGGNAGISVTSNLLDDYEEGTFTPVLRDATSGGNVSATAATYAAYTKVGRLVSVVVYFTNISTTGMTAANDIFLTGLPYTAASTAGTTLFCGSAILTATTFTGVPVASVFDNTDYAKIAKTATGAAISYVKVSDFTTGGSDLWVQVTYDAVT